MTGGQTAVGLAAAALVIANQVEHQPLQLGRVLGNATGNLGKAEIQWGELIFEAVGVIVLVVVAGIGQYGVKIAGLVVVALWLLFLINVSTKKKASSLSSTGVSVNGSRSSSQAVAA